MKYLIFLIIAGQIFSQATITGVVVDEAGQPLEFVNVYVKGTIYGDVTAVDGSFKFELKNLSKDTLIASFIGFKSKVLKIANDGTLVKSFNILLKEDINRDDVVEITASAFITDAEKRVVIAKPLDVVTTPGAAADINRFFQTLPGVTSVDDGAGLFVRGGNVNETVMEIDGATIVHPYKFESPSGGFFGTISPFLTSGSAFYTGALSAQYGNVLSGMVDMQSIGLLDENAYQIGLGLAALSARADHVFIKDKLTLSASGNYSDTEPMMKLNNHQTDFHTFPTNYDVNVNLNYKFGVTHSMKLFLFKESNEVSAEIEQPDLQLFYTGVASNRLANLMFKGAVNSRLLYQANLAYTQYENENSIGSGGSVRSDDMLQFKLKGEYLLGELSSLNFGADFRNLRYDYTGNWHFHPDSVTLGIAGQTYDESYQVDYIGAFSELKLPLNKNLIFRLGARLEGEKASSEYYVDPRFSVAYQLTENVTLSSSYGRYHQLPSLNYYLNEQHIEMQESEGYTLGANYNDGNDFLIRVELYSKDYTKLIKKIGLENEQQFNNTGYGHSKGLDFMIKQKTNKLEYWLSYSYLEARRNELYFVKLTSPEFDITHNFTAVGKMNFLTHFMAGAKYVYRTGKPYTSSAVLSEQHNRRLPDYGRFDISLSYLTRLFSADQTVFYISLNNVFGKENVLNRRYNSDYSASFDQKGAFTRVLYFGMNIKI
jgi:hypothetical protein